MTPLNKIKRKILLSSLVILFLILAPWVLMISFGYKIDDVTGLVKTGGLYIHSEIPNSSVYINGEYIKNNNTIFKNVLVQKLKPNQFYKIEINKEGYQSWVKKIYIYPSLVSEGHVLMLPNEFVKREIFPFFDKDGNGIPNPTSSLTKIKKTKSGRIIPENQEYIDAVTLLEGENPYEIKVPELISSTSSATSTKEEILPNYYIELGIKDPKKLKNLIETSDEISWIKDGDVVLYWINKIESIPYYYCDGEEVRLCDKNIVLDWGDEIKKFKYLPGRNDVWIILVNSGIYAVEVDPRSQRNIQKIYLGDNLDFEISKKGNLLIKDKDSLFELAL
jgi:hypothetical protein